MKRGRVILISFSLVLILSLSLVSAGWFSNFFGKMTGRVTDSAEICPDFNNDGIVNNTDYDLFVIEFNQPVTDNNEEYDLNSDGEINFSDYVLFAKEFGKECSVVSDFEDSVEPETSAPLQPEPNVTSTEPNSTSTESSTVPEICPDFNNDGIVNDTDYTLFSDNYNKPVTSETAMYDLNSNGKIDFADYVIFAKNSGRNCVSSFAENKNSENSSAVRAGKPTIGCIGIECEERIPSDFNDDGCVDNSDREFADKEISEWIEKMKSIPVQYKEPDCTRTKDVADEFCKRLLENRDDYFQVSSNTFEIKRSTQTMGVYLPSGNLVPNVRAGYDFFNIIECQYFVEGSGKARFEKYVGRKLNVANGAALVSACYQEVDSDSGAGYLREAYDQGRLVKKGPLAIEVKGNMAYLTNEFFSRGSYDDESLKRFDELFSKYNLDGGYDSEGVRKWLNFMWDADDKSEFDKHLGEGCIFERVEEQQFISGDFDNNGCVGFSDFLSFSQIFGTEKKIISIGSAKKYNPLMDFDGDSKINFADFLAFSKVYGSGCDANQRSLDINLLEGQPAPKKAVNCQDYSSEERRSECWIIRAGIDGDDSLCGNIIDSENEQNEENLKFVCAQKANWKNYEVLINFADYPSPASYAIDRFSVDESGIYVALFWPHEGIEKYDFLGNPLGAVDTMPENPLPFCGSPYCSVSPPVYISFNYGGQSYGYGYSGLFKDDLILNSPPQLRGGVKQVAVLDEVYVWIDQQIGKLKINRLGYKD